MYIVELYLHNSRLGALWISSVGRPNLAQWNVYVCTKEVKTTTHWSCFNSINYKEDKMCRYCYSQDACPHDLLSVSTDSFFFSSTY